MGPRAYTIVAQGEITRIVTAKPDERRAILEEAAGVQGFRDKIVLAQRRLEDTELNISRLNDIITEVSKQVAILKRQAARARNRQQLKDEIKRLDSALFVDKLCLFDTEQKGIIAELDSAGQEELELSEALSAKQNVEESARSELMNIDVIGDELRKNIDRIKDELSAKDRIRGEHLAKIGELKALISGVEAEISNLKNHKTILVNRVNDYKKEILELQEQSKSITDERLKVEESSGGEVARIGLILEEKKNYLREIESSLRMFRDDVVALKATHTSLSEQLVDESPVERLKQFLHENSCTELLPNSVQLLVDGIKVPDHLAKAVQAIFQDKAAYLVVEHPHNLMLELHKISGEKLPFGIGVINKNIELNFTNNEEVPFKSLLSHLEIHEDFKPLISILLRNVYVASSIEEASDYFANLGKDDIETVLVTPSGHIITYNMFSELSGESGIIQTRNKVGQIYNKLKDAENQYNKCENTCALIRNEIESLEKEQVMLLGESKKVQDKILELSSKAGQIQGRLDGLYNSITNIDSDIKSNEEQSHDAENRLDALQYRLEMAEEELEKDLANQDTSLEDELAKFNNEYDGLERRRQEKRLQLNEIMRVVEDLKQQVDSLRIKGAGLELKKQKNALAIDNIKEKVITEYGEEEWGTISVQAISANPLEDFIREEYEQNVAKIRVRLLREGDVDPESITRLEEEKTRLEQLEQQRNDVEKASRILKKTIARLTETSIERFMSTYEAVKNNFEHLIPQLFNGGYGTLELTDPSNPLESGLDLTVRPPGKKLKSIELLSGGEKGLCAIALIFSMFLQRPSPLCILDEVDAPFDEVNLSRFISLVKEMSSRTQFLMITHNKQSMAVCDNLVGVTMQEPGASKILTVSLEEAYAQVA